MKLKIKIVVCTHWIFLSVQYSRMYCTYDFLRFCTYDYIALTRQIMTESSISLHAAKTKVMFHLIMNRL